MLIGGFQPFSLSDFPGKSAAILFTQGCNFCCPYCHNYSLWQTSLPGPCRFDEKKILEFLDTRQIQLDGLVITGGEPTLQPDLMSFINKVKDKGLAVKLDTNGSKPEVITRLIAGGLVDYIAMDVKAPFEKYNRLCGLHVDIPPVKQSIEVISRSRVAHHFRTTYYPKELTEEDIACIKQTLPPPSRYLVQEYKKSSPLLP